MGLYYEMTIKGLKPDVVAYTSLIDGHFKNGYTDAALQLYRKMIGAGVAPNVFTVSCVIDGLCKEGMINNAIIFFLEQTKARFSGDEVDCTGNHCVSNVPYSILINGLCRNGRVFQASKFFYDMRKSGLQPLVCDYAAIVEGHFGAKHVFAVMMLQADMLKSAVLPSAFMYQVLKRGYKKMGLFALAHNCCG